MIRINRKRARQGLSPIRGTAWMTPPSYPQSQTQYNQPRNDNYVPTYTENANDFDAGYYDNEGNFHPNPNKMTANALVSDETGATSAPAFPEDAHLNHTNPGVGSANVFDNFHRDFGTYYNGADDIDLDNITRPAGPPPSFPTTS